MNTERRKLVLLHRLERIRAIARQSAAAEVARAEATLGQCQSLAERTRALATSYANRTSARDGAELRLLGHFSIALQAVQTSTDADVLRARAAADRKQGELAAAERRRAAVEDRAVAAGQALARQQAERGLGATGASRASFGTDLD